MIVANKRTYRGPGVYIGRPSKWGNPFSHLPNTVARYKVDSREKAIEYYERWAHKMLELEPDFLDGLRDAPALICWCAPLACHGDVLRRMIEQKFDKS